jgi:hypothetical protein
VVRLERVKDVAWKCDGEVKDDLIKLVRTFMVLLFPVGRVRGRV